MTDVLETLSAEVINPATEKFARRLRVAMAMKNTTHITLALKVGVTRQSVWMWVNGNNMPNAARLKPLADALGCTVEWLMSEDSIDLGVGGPKE